MMCKMPRFTRMVSVSALAVALAAPMALAPVFTAPAHAFFGGFGRIVYDPTNHAENLLTAARTLEQINNQIASLQNEAQMLINQARNLASLPYSSLQALQQNVQRTQQLLGEAQNIAFDVQNIDQMFQQDYGNLSLTATDQQLIADARTRWENTVGGLQDAMRVQAGAWARRMQRSRAMSQGARIAAHAVRSGDSHGGGSSVSLSESDRT